MQLQQVLAKYFESGTIYQGLRYLLDANIQCQDLHFNDNQLSGTFSDKVHTLRCNIRFTDEISDITHEKTAAIISSQCDQCRTELCQHLAATMLQYISKEDALGDDFDEHSFDEHSFKGCSLRDYRDFIKQQHYNPYPNMARHRVVYLLQPAVLSETTTAKNDIQPQPVLNVAIHKAYIRPDGSYYSKGPLKKSEFLKDKTPKFITLTDQAIVRPLLASSTACIDNKQFIFQLSTQCTEDLLAMMIASGRCFWQTCEQAAIEDLSQIKELQAADSQLQQGRQSITPDPLFFDEKSSGEIASDVFRPDEKASDVKSPEAFTPKLEITTSRADFAWQPSASVELDIAQVSFIGIDPKHSPQQSVSLEQLLHSVAKASQSAASQSDSGAELSFSPLLLEQPTQEGIINALAQLPNWPMLCSSQSEAVCQQIGEFDFQIEKDICDLALQLLRLRQQGWQIEFAAAYRLQQQHLDDWYIDLQTLPTAADNRSIGLQNWFEMELGLQIEGEQVNILPHLLNAIQQNQSLQQGLTIQLEDGRFVKLSEQRLASITAIFDELAQSNRSQPKQSASQSALQKNSAATKQKLQLPHTQLHQIAQLYSASGQQNSMRWTGDAELKNKAQQLADVQSIKTAAIPSLFKGELRPYQHFGYSWLQFLAHWGFNGILADDMGLGKTAQMLCQLAAIKQSYLDQLHDEQTQSNPSNMDQTQTAHASPISLVIAPTSLLNNWQSETEKFCPQLKAFIYHGSQRQQTLSALDLGETDLIITSYALLQRDIDVLNTLPFHYCILDEAHLIKNSQSKTTRAVKTIQCRHKVCLTGTPMENHMGELWSLFDFLMPGFLGNKQTFRQVFQYPIEKENNQQQKQKLSQRIAPFVLRRTKSLVAQELPPKSEIIQWLTLTDQQADVYETVRLAMIDKIQQAYSQQQQTGLTVSNALLRLRQICCHPQMSKLAEASAIQESAKLQWLQENVKEMVEEGRRILIFSSFTQMLEHVANTLQKLDISYQTLTGKTRNRAQVIERFQQGKADVFLISLKAGGSGLNLTQADTVIHTDPWWNPAAEQQASDRAYRIGQDKPVFVYKLISKNTVEQRIYDMQQQKQSLTQGLLQQNQDSIQANLQQNWQQLLTPLSEQ